MATKMLDGDNMADGDIEAPPARVVTVELCRDSRSRLAKQAFAAARVFSASCRHHRVHDGSNNVRPSLRHAHGHSKPPHPEFLLLVVNQSAAALMRRYASGPQRCRSTPPSLLLRVVPTMPLGYQPLENARCQAWTTHFISTVSLSCAPLTRISPSVATKCPLFCDPVPC